MNTYKEHYASCRESHSLLLPENRKYDSLYELTVDNSLLGELDKDLISRIHEKFCYKIDNNVGCFSDAHAIRINEWQDIEEIKTLTDSFMPILEEQIFGCHASIEYLHPYRNITRETSIKSEWDTNELESSWKWHYDDCPREFLKFFIYLNEVTENSGCLKYLTDKSGEAPVLESFRIAPGRHARPQIYTGSRIPTEVIQKKIEEKGWKVKNVVGPAGTYVVHTPNIYHRASCPAPGSNPRDVLFFFIRPKKTEHKPYINEGTKAFNIKGETFPCKQYDLD
jgi:hypothetical protein